MEQVMGSIDARRLALGGDSVSRQRGRVQREQVQRSDLQEFPVFASMSDRVAWASAWVKNNESLLRNKIRTYHKGSSTFSLTEMDFEDFLGDAVLLLTEATVKAERKGLPWYSIFWFDFDRMLISSQSLHYVKLCADLEDEVENRLIECPDVDSMISEFNDRLKQESRDDYAIRTALPLLTARERMAFELVSGFGGVTSMSTSDAGEVMGISAADVRKLLIRAQEKVQKAGQIHFGSGKVLLFPIPTKRGVPVGTKRKNPHNSDAMAQVAAR